MSMEDQLREALRRRDPSVGFAERVAARAESGGRAEPGHSFRWLRAVSAMAVIAPALFTSTSLWQRTREERAGRQAVMALRIASEKLNQARSQVLRQTESQ